jgi:hypothetical protein
MLGGNTGRFKVREEWLVRVGKDTRGLDRNSLVHLEMAASPFQGFSLFTSETPWNDQFFTIGKQKCL